MQSRSVVSFVVVCVTWPAMVSLGGCSAKGDHALHVPDGVRYLCPETELRASSDFSNTRFRLEGDRLSDFDKTTHMLLEPRPAVGHSLQMTTIGVDGNRVTYTAYQVGKEQGLLVHVRSRGNDRFGASWAWDRALPLSASTWNELKAHFDDTDMWSPRSPWATEEYPIVTVTEFQDGAVLDGRSFPKAGVPRGALQVQRAKALKDKLSALASCPRPTGD